MPTLLLDFDSTLICCESLEEICKEHLDPDTQKDIQLITNAGMEGQISFAESLSLRLKLAQPSKTAIDKFTANPERYLTLGMKELITSVQDRCDIWIISGGLVDVIYPFAKVLNIPKEHVRGITGRWYGEVFHLKNSDPFVSGKIEGCRTLVQNWKTPTLAVGDGITDFALYQEGLVDHFLPYTEHVTREFVKAEKLSPVRNTKELKSAIHHFLEAIKS